MDTATQSVLFNALPLLVLAGVYLLVAAALIPAVWRGRAEAQVIEVAPVVVFPAVAFAAAVLGLLVLRDRTPVGGHVWLALIAILVAILPALLVLVRWRDRELVTGGLRRARAAEELVSLRDRELEAVAAISTALARARSPEEAARPLVRQVRNLLGVEFAAVALVDNDAATASGIVGELADEDVAWWRELSIDLHGEPSGISSAVLDAAPLTVYDVTSSPRVSQRLVELVGARSGAWVPMIAEERVVGVLVAATTTRNLSFGTEELALLQALAGEAALAVERMRSSRELAQALAREQRMARLVRKVHAELQSESVVRVATEELREALGLNRVAIELDRVEREGVPIAAAGERIGTLVLERDEPLADAERLLVEMVAGEVGLALHTARLLTENERRLARQGALLEAAQVVTSELELEAVLHHLVEEVAGLLRADAADCYLLDAERGLLRCAAVHGLDPALIGFECPAGHGIAARAISAGRPVSSGEYGAASQRMPHPAYDVFSSALVAPIVWAGETHGLLGVGLRADRHLDEEDVNVFEAFTALASLALRNAETFGEGERQARVQRAFHRIAALLSDPLSLGEAYDAAAHAAVEALGGDYGVVLMHTGAELEVVGSHDLPERSRALVHPPALREAAADGNLLVATRLATDERFGDDWRRAGVASLLAIPVVGQAPGLVVVFFVEPRTFSGDDLDLARHVAQAARGALERSRLFEAERTARSLSQRLARTSGLLATELDPAAVLDEVADQARMLVEADAAAIAAFGEYGLVVAAAAGDPAARAVGSALPSAGRLAGDAVQLRAPVVCDDADDDRTPLAADPVLALGYRAYAGVPLASADGELYGVLAVYGVEPRRWREDEVEALSALAANASVTLANAELYRRVAIEHQQSAAILANVADGIVALDRDGTVVAWNAAAETITGVPSSEAVGHTTGEVLQRDLQSEAGGTNRLVSITRGVDEVRLSLSEAVMRDPEGDVAGRIFAFRDISEEWAVDQMKSDFVSTVSHELRAPLTSIYGFAETLLREDVEFDESERKTFLRYISSESESLRRIVDELLDVARLDQGELSVALAPTEVGPVVAEAIAAVGPPANGHSIVVDLDEADLLVRADRDKLRQVIAQLVENAVKYSPGGGAVRIEGRRRQRAVEIGVSDEGIGIAPAEHDRIFEKFYRVAGDEPGTGLGLFIVRGLVSAMGGRVRLDSDEGRGARFSFELPLAGEE